MVQGENHLHSGFSHQQWCWWLDPIKHRWQCSRVGSWWEIISSVTPTGWSVGTSIAYIVHFGHSCYIIVVLKVEMAGGTASCQIFFFILGIRYRLSPAGNWGHKYLLFSIGATECERYERLLYTFEFTWCFTSAQVKFPWPKQKILRWVANTYQRAAHHSLRNHCSPQTTGRTHFSFWLDVLS